MAKVQASYNETFQLRVSSQTALHFFLTPESMVQLMPDVERMERRSASEVHWVLTAKNESGVKFQPTYTLRYEASADNRVTWQTIEGNIDITGSITLTAREPFVTEVLFEERVAPDLPITPLTAAIFKPLVARALRSDIRHYVDNIKNHFEQLAQSQSAA